MSPWIVYLLTILLEKNGASPSTREITLKIKHTTFEDPEALKEAFECWHEPDCQALIQKLIPVHTLDGGYVLKVRQIFDSVVIEKPSFAHVGGNKICPHPRCRSRNIRDEDGMNVCNDCGCGWSHR